MSTGQDPMKEAERLLDEYGLNCATMKGREESPHSLRLRDSLLAHIRKLVEAQPAAVAGEADGFIGEHHITPENVQARIAQLRRFADPEQSTQAEWENLDWRGFCNTTGFIMEFLAAPAAPLVGEPLQRQVELRACGHVHDGPSWCAECALAEARKTGEFR